MIDGAPNLDDRGFDELMADAKAWIQRRCPDWNDLSPGDPGIVILEVFAHLTEVMLYRMNRLPDKAYVAFLNLLGAQMRPPAAARVLLRFERSDDSGFLEIPQGTRVQSAVAIDDGEPPVFSTERRVVFEPGQTNVEVAASDGRWIEGELIGVGSGMPGQDFIVANVPIVSSGAGADSLIVAVAVDDNGEHALNQTVSWEQEPFEIWSEVNDFANLVGDERVCRVDRVQGRISFAPALEMADGSRRTLAAVPENGREIRVWYRSGGGNRGNVPAESLTSMKDAIPGVTVSNPRPATGGVDAESLENALRRAPQLLRTLDRAVTATDYELLARQGSAVVGRAKAFTQAQIWAHAEPGTVELLLVPQVADDDRLNKALSADFLQGLQTEEALESVAAYIESRKTIGARCAIKWTNYKTVRVRARVVVRQVEDVAAVRMRLLRRLNAGLQALPNKFNRNGWSYGAPLHASAVYNILLSEAGVVFVDNVRLVVDDAPDVEVHAMEADSFQKDTWYAGEDEKLFRSMNNGEGWELIRRFGEGEKILRVEVHPDAPGRIAVVSERGDEEDKREWLLHVSSDCGESWAFIGRLQFNVRDAAWMREDHHHFLLLATDQGLYKIEAVTGSVPMPVVVNPQKPTMKLWYVETAESDTGASIVAVAGQDQTGVFLSIDGTQEGAFMSVGLERDDVRVLRFQRQGPNRFLWAGLYTFGLSEGDGCCRLAIQRTMSAKPNWDRYSAEWRGGNCVDLACTPTKIFAATHHAGVLELSTNTREPAWKAPAIDCGLGLRDVGRFHQVYAVAARLDGDVCTTMASGPIGVFRRAADAMAYSNVSAFEFRDRVTLPRTWQFTPGEHEIEVVREYEA